MELEQTAPAAALEWHELSPLAEAWTEFLLRFPMQWFCTMTFRQKPEDRERERPRLVHPERADKLWRVWLSKLNREIYGREWYRAPHKSVFWIRALEYHRSGVLHYHALVGDARDMNEQARRLTWMDQWYELAGIARIEQIDSAARVREYVSKYVMKGGELECSSSLRFAAPPA